jgi:hypothetical protein
MRSTSIGLFSQKVHFNPMELDHLTQRNFGETSHFSRIVLTNLRSLSRLRPEYTFAQRYVVAQVQGILRFHALFYWLFRQTAAVTLACLQQPRACSFSPSSEAWWLELSAVANAPRYDRGLVRQLLSHPESCVDVLSSASALH